MPNPMMKFYRSNGQPLVMNGDTIEDTLGSGTRRFNLPRLRLIPDADDTYYMRVSSTSSGTGRFWVYFGDNSITSSRGDRNSSNCNSGRTNANCKIHAAGNPHRGPHRLDRRRHLQGHLQDRVMSSEACADFDRVTREIGGR